MRYQTISGVVVLLLISGVGWAQRLQPRVSYTINGAAIWVASGDFDGDGRTDLSVGNNTNTAHEITTFYSRLNNTPLKKTTQVVSNGFPSRLRAADFNQDGISDLAFFNGASLAIANGRSDRTFGTIQNLASVPSPGNIAVGDLNNDGLTDIVYSDNNSSSVRLMFQSTTGFVGGSIFTGITSPRGLAIGDLNHDGRPDIAVARETSGSTILYSNPDGTYQQSGGAGVRPTDIITGDFTGDGLTDLAYAEWSGYIGIMTFQSAIVGSPQLYPVISTADSIATGDFDRDGHPDLVAASQNFSIVSVLMGNADGTYGRRVDLGASYSGTASVEVGDFNMDGFDDFAVASASGNAVDFFYAIPEPACGLPTLVILAALQSKRPRNSVRSQTASRAGR